jgi:hypothetical protein
MFERFTERARQVVVLAREEAPVLRHDYIGTEHILLGLLREEDGLAARVLTGLGLTVDRARGEVVRIVGAGQEVTSGQIPFTPRAKKVLELALREALSLGHEYIGTEHILLGLLREDERMMTESEGVAMRILLHFDADTEKIRSEVHRLLSDTSTPREQPGPARSAPPRDESGRPIIPFDPTALLAIDLAKREAASLGQEHVSTEHILLGLQLSGQGLAARILQHLGVTIERARPLIVAIVGSAEPRPFGEIPFTPAVQAGRPCVARVSVARTRAGTAGARRAWAPAELRLVSWRDAVEVSEEVLGARIDGRRGAAGDLFVDLMLALEPLGRPEARLRVIDVADHEATVRGLHKHRVSLAQMRSLADLRGNR